MNKHPTSRETGVIILAMLLVVVVAGSALMLSAFNNSPTRISLTEQAEILREMENAKAALIGYATSVHVNFNAGPARFPCPDTDGDGLPYQGISYTSCPITAFFGRLPEYAPMETRRFNLSSRFANTDQQFWYAVSPAFLHSNATSQVANTSVDSLLTVDGEAADDFDDVLALIIAPGAALETQDRISNPNDFSAYLEGANGESTAFVTYSAVADLNDRIMTITRGEIIDQVTRQVAHTMMNRLDTYHSSNNSYPKEITFWGITFATAQQMFTTTINSSANTYHWVKDTSSHSTGQDWVTITAYTLVSADVAKLQFTGCNIVFTLTHDSGVTQDRSSCNDPPPSP